MRLAFISILRRLLGPQFDFLAIICSQVVSLPLYTDDTYADDEVGDHGITSCGGITSAEIRSCSGFMWMKSALIDTLKTHGRILCVRKRNTERRKSNRERKRPRGTRRRQQATATGSCPIAIAHCPTIETT